LPEQQAFARSVPGLAERHLAAGSLRGRRTTAPPPTVARPKAARHWLVVVSMGSDGLDTRNPTSKLMLTILGGVATCEREIMLERQREGIAKAKAEGKYKGRKPTVAVQAEQIRAMRAPGEKPAHIARRLGVAHSSVYRMLGGVVGTSGGMSAAAGVGAAV
jgi:hypothetical protein